MGQPECTRKSPYLTTPPAPSLLRPSSQNLRRHGRQSMVTPSAYYPPRGPKAMPATGLLHGGDRPVATPTRRPANNSEPPRAWQELEDGGKLDLPSAPRQHNQALAVTSAEPYGGSASTQRKIFPGRVQRPSSADPRTRQSEPAASMRILHSGSTGLRTHAWCPMPEGGKAWSALQPTGMPTPAAMGAVAMTGEVVSGDPAIAACAIKLEVPPVASSSAAAAAASAIHVPSARPGCSEAAARAATAAAAAAALPSQRTNAQLPNPPLFSATAPATTASKVAASSPSGGTSLASSLLRPPPPRPSSAFSFWDGGGPSYGGVLQQGTAASSPGRGVAVGSYRGGWGVPARRAESASGGVGRGEGRRGGVRSSEASDAPSAALVSAPIAAADGPALAPSAAPIVAALRRDRPSSAGSSRCSTPHAGGNRAYSTAMAATHDYLRRGQGCSCQTQWEVGRPESELRWPELRLTDAGAGAEAQNGVAARTVAGPTGTRPACRRPASASAAGKRAVVGAPALASASDKTAPTVAQALSGIRSRLGPAVGARGQPRIERRCESMSR